MEVIRVRRRNVVFKAGRHVFSVDTKLFFLIHKQGFGDGVYSTKAFVKERIGKLRKGPANRNAHNKALKEALKHVTKTVGYDSVLDFMLKKAEKEIALDTLLGRRQLHATKTRKLR